MPLISPLLWQGLPFKHADGEMDFLGMHDHWHAMLGKTIGGIPEYDGAVRPGFGGAIGLPRW
jgi:hypothetical protein